ncbi:MAG: DUF1631 family protein, partial [Gammaproteobacteria bacterium]
MTDSTSPENQRRYPRQELIHDATVTGDRIGEQPCQIRDYCPGGMFLAWRHGGGAPPPLARGDRVKVTFGVRLKERGERSQEVTGTVAWTFDHGFGIAFEQLDSDTARILSKLAEATRRRKEQLRKTAPPPAEAGALWQKLRTLLDQHLRLILADLLRQVDEQLFQDAAKATSNAEQADFFAAIKAIKREREAITRRVEEQLHERLEGLQGGQGSGPRQEAGGNGLSLVDEQEFETFLALSSTIARLEQQYKKELFCIEQRLSRLSGGEVDPEDNPFGVAALLKSIARGFLPLALGKAPTMSLIHSIEATAAPSLGHLYREANELLAGAGVLPDLDYDRHQEALRRQYLERRKSASRSPAGPAPREEDLIPSGTVPPEAEPGAVSSGPGGMAAGHPHPATGPPPPGVPHGPAGAAPSGARQPAAGEQQVPAASPSAGPASPSGAVP